MTTGTFPSKSAQVIAEKTRDLIAPISDYSLYLCHDLSGTTLVDSAPVDQQILGDYTVNGTTAGIWAEESNFTPAGDHTGQFNSAAQQAAGRLDNLNGQIIFFVDVFATGAPATNFNTFLCYGDNGGGGTDGLRFAIAQTTGKFTMRSNDAAGELKNALSDADVCDSTKHSIMGVADPVNNTITVYTDGGAATSVALDGDNLSTTSAWGWGMLANLTNNNPTYNTELGSEGIAGLYINRMGIMRTTSDQTANIGAIATGLSDIAHELPWAMDGI